MKLDFQFSRLPGALLGLVFAINSGVAPTADAATIWTGPDIEFTQSDTNFSDELVPGAVALCRNFSQWLFNSDVEDGPAFGTPTDTEWAFGSLANYASLNYRSFYSLQNGDLSDLLVTDPPSPMVVHLVNEKIYLSLTFSAWPQHGGFFAYTRSTPASSASPSVTITNPASGAVFAAPANVNIGAVATVAGGLVTNVQFFANATSLGSAQSAPFSITTGSLGAGPYALTAVATAAGVSATSSVVDIAVVSPVTITLSSPQTTGSQFSFDYTADPGLNYVVQDSSNLVNWLSLVTNVAAGNPVHFTDGFIANGARYYRVARVPGP
jgi:hypothetical protein